MGITITDLIAGGIDVITVPAPKVTVLAVAGGMGMGSSHYYLHKDYICISGGHAGSDHSTMPPFEGGSPDSVFNVTQRFRNRVA